MTAVAPTPIAPHLLADSLPQLPADYLLPYSFSLPETKFVGVLACQRNPLLRELTARVVSCRKGGEVPETGKGKGKGGKKELSAKPKAAEEVYEIELDDTVLFPEGGGQPSDTGLLLSLASGKAVTVSKVLRHGLTAVHYASAPLGVGEEVRAVVDWDRRWDLMTQHTAQHVLSGLFDTLPLPTLSWSLQPSPQPSYIELPRAPTPSELTSIQARANALILSNVRVHVSMALPESAGRPESLPADYVGGVVREVDIVGVDKGPCCGTHIPSLGFLQSIHVLPTTTSVRGTNARVYFLAGPRVLLALAGAGEQVREAARELGCAQGEVAPKVKDLVLRAREERRRAERATEEVMGYVAREWLREGGKSVGGVRVGVVHRKVGEGEEAGEVLSLLSFALRNALGEGEPYLIVLAASAPSSPLMIIGSDEAAVGRAGEGVKKEMGGKVRGGGRGRWQGKRVEGGAWKEEELGGLEEILERAVGEGSA